MEVVLMCWKMKAYLKPLFGIDHLQEKNSIEFSCNHAWFRLHDFFQFKKS